LDKAPDAFRTISEVADDLDIPQHVLRFWETRFTQIKPMKRSGGRRYYRPDDVDLLRGIRRLLYGEGYTIRGVQRILKEHGIKSVQGLVDGSSAAPTFAALDGATSHEADLQADVSSNDLDDDEDEVAEAPTTARRAPEVAVPLPRAEPVLPKAPSAAPRIENRAETGTARKLEVPRLDIPRPDIPKLDTQKLDTPRLDIPRLDIPRPDIPRLDIPRLKTALEELIACRQLLDQALKEG
jgi:DNA-binding transcriptional MerR regulator